MVNKMKLNLLFLCFAFFTLNIAEALSAPNGFEQIKQRQYVACGTSADYPALAWQKDGQWYGFDADICRAIAHAFLGDPGKFKMIPIKKKNIGKALNSSKIDVMLGNSSLLSSEEVSLFVTPVDTLYYDRQIFAAREKRKAKSMHDFKEKKVCVIANSNASVFLNEYNQKQALGFKILPLNSLMELKEAFYTNRCELVTDSEIFLHHTISDINAKNKAEILPEKVAYIPIKAYTAGNNPYLNIAIRWILNALKLAEASDINSQNIQIFTASKNPSIQNLIGANPKTWTKLGLNPLWARDYISSYGNYRQIINRNIGEGSELNLNIRQNNLINKGGFLVSQPFI